MSNFVTVAARTRQLNHRLKARKQAILDRRATEPSVSVRATSPSNVALMNGASQTASAALASLSSGGQASAPGFVAVNARPQSDTNGTGETASKGVVSRSTHSELLSKFFTLAERRQQAASAGTAIPGGTEIRRSISSGSAAAAPAAATGTSATKATRSGTTAASTNTAAYNDADYATLLLNSASPVPIPGTPASLLPPHATRPAPSEKDDGGPYKAEMVARMEGLSKGERIIPPCDRCRRLHMDCLKNLTACMGCTKKHAKCSWKEVRDAELLETAKSTTHDPRPGSDDGDLDPDDDAGSAESDLRALERMTADHPAPVSEPIPRGPATPAGRSPSADAGFPDHHLSDRDVDLHPASRHLPGLPKSVPYHAAVDAHGSVHLPQPQAHHRHPSALPASPPALAALPSLREITSPGPVRTNGHGMHHGLENGGMTERNGRHMLSNHGDGHGESMKSAASLSAPDMASTAALHS